MTKARRNIVCLESTPYYHVISRCVRRAFLCGQDHYSGQDYEHRRQWIEKRLAVLSNVFSIEICAYAIMSNHYHLVVHIDKASVSTLSFDAVIDRWLMLHKGPVLVQRYKAGDALGEAERDVIGEIVEQWRERLYDLGWFMKCLNETIAREANAEDHCTGCFWEGRYKSQALLTEQALLTCMAYVDLNPIRAAMVDTLEMADYTSVQERLRRAKRKEENSIRLKPFSGTLSTDASDSCLPFQALDYLELVDWSARQIREDKRGCIAAKEPALLESLGITEKDWLGQINHYNARYYRAVGTLGKAMELAKRLGRQWFKTPQMI